MSDYADAQLVRTHGPVNTRRAVIYTSNGRPITRALSTNRNGRLEVIINTDEIATVLLDLSQMIDDGEEIENITTSGPATLGPYSKTTAHITFNAPSHCPQNVDVAVRFSSHEQIIARFVLRLPDRCDAMTSAADQTRGVL